MSQPSHGCQCLRRLTVDMVHESHFTPQLFQEMLVTMPSTIPVVRAPNSASAELRLTDCCVRDPPETVAFSIAQHRRLYSCRSWADLPSRRLSECSDFALCNLDTLQVSCHALHVHLVVLSETQDLSCCFQHAVHAVCVLSMFYSFPTAVLQTARLSLSNSTSDSVVGVLLTLGRTTGRESSSPSTAIRLGCTSDSFQPGIRKLFSRSLGQERTFDRPAVPVVPHCAS